MAAPAPMGAYVTRRGFLHRLDARVKLAALLMASAAAFACTSWRRLALAGVALLALARAAGVTPSSVLRALRPTAVVLAFCLLANALVMDGTASVPLVGPLGVSPAGALRGLTSIGRIVVLVGFSLVVSATTTPTELAAAVSWAIRPLGRVGMPVEDVAMTVSVALRFLPFCVEELDRVRAAQEARGMRFDEGSLPRRLRSSAALLVPLTVGLFSRSEDLAQAMRDRRYRGRGRTWTIAAPGRRDLALLALCALVCVIVSLL